MKQSFLHLTLTNKGGAGSAANRLHSAVKNYGLRSTLIVHDAAKGDLSVLKIKSFRSSIKVFSSKVFARLLTRREFHFMNDDFSNPDIDSILSASEAVNSSIIVVYASALFLSFEQIYNIQCRTGAPVIWFLMDMACFTGGCHYAWDCEGYKRDCGYCPAIRVGAGQGNASARTLRRKSQALSDMNFVIVAGSTFLADQARASSVFRRHRIEVIPVGVSPELFRPRDRSALRSKWSVSPDDKLVFFGARQSTTRKGMSVLRDALLRIATTQSGGRLPTLLIAGDASEFMSLQKEGYQVRAVGVLGPEELAEAYSAADLFISPSIEDSGPMMINEAVMSGTPIVSFPIGVALDLVRPGVTGEFASLGDALALADAISRVLGWDATKWQHASQTARSIGLEILAPSAQAARFVQLAEELRR